MRCEFQERLLNWCVLAPFIPLVEGIAPPIPQGIRRMGNVWGVSTMMSSVIRLATLLSGGREGCLDTS